MKTKEKQPISSNIDYIKLTMEIMRKMNERKQKCVYQLAKSISGKE